MRKELKVVCFGDSLTAGKRFPDHLRWTQIARDILSLTTGHEWLFFNRGVPGETAVMGLQRFERDVQPHLPATVLVAFGTNDSSVAEGSQAPRLSPKDFTSTIETILVRIRSAGGLPILLTPHPMRGNSAVPERIKAYIEILCSLGERIGIPIIPMHSEIPSRFGCPDVWLSDDGVHLSGTGQRCYARVIADYFSKGDFAVARNPDLTA